MGRIDRLVKKNDHQAYRVYGVIPPEKIPDEGREFGPTTSQQMEHLYQEQREVKGCLWLVAIAVALTIAISLYYLWHQSGFVP